MTPSSSSSYSSATSINPTPSNASTAANSVNAILEAEYRKVMTEAGGTGKFEGKGASNMNDLS